MLIAFLSGEAALYFLQMNSHHFKALLCISINCVPMFYCFSNGLKVYTLIYNFLSQGLNDILELLTKLSQEYDRHELIPGLALLVAAKCFRTVAESEVKVIYSIVKQLCCSWVGSRGLVNY